MKKIKVALLYIAIGRYSVFWEYFYQSAEKFLLTECDKHYFIFTDNSQLFINDNVTRVQQEKLGWPYDTLMRFDFFLSIKDQLEKFDYVLFFNGNTEILSRITEKDILPLEGQKKLIFALQPHMFHLKINNFTYERNPMSSAYITYNDGKYYFTGAFNGGEVKSYIKMCETISKNIKDDLENKIIALWHDESHLNKYAVNRDDIKILPPYFFKGESEYWKKSKVVFLDKSHYRFGGHDYLRGESDKKISQQEWESKNISKNKFLKFRVKQYVKSLYF